MPFVDCGSRDGEVCRTRTRELTLSPGRAVRNSALNTPLSGPRAAGTVLSPVNALSPLQSCYVYDPISYCMRQRKYSSHSVAVSNCSIFSDNSNSMFVTSSAADAAACGQRTACKGFSPHAVSCPPGDAARMANLSFASGAEVDASGDAPTIAAHPHPLAQPCRCSLSLERLFEDAVSDRPQPALPMSKCEYHEILRALPPRLQNRPWRLAFDTARDGFSLLNFYRNMESAHGERANGIGILFVTDRNASAGNARRPNGRSASAPAQSPTLSSSKKFRADTAAAEASGDDAPMPPRLGIVGCFTPEVPCLRARGGGSHASYGSPETFVFRLHVTGKRVHFAGVPAAPVGGGRPPRAESNPPRSSLTSPLELSCRSPSDDGATPFVVPHSAREGTLGRPRSLSSSARHSSSGPASARTGPRPGSSTAAIVTNPLHEMFSSTESSTQILPLSTRMGGLRAANDSARAHGPSPLCESDLLACAERSGRDAAGESLTTAPQEDDGEEEQQQREAAALDSPVYAASPVSRTARTGASRPTEPAADFPQMPPAVYLNGCDPYLQEAAETDGMPEAVAHTPLLCKYPWTGCATQRQFVTAHSSFFAIGGGSDGAALYVDRNLQYGTSSCQCSTFGSPALFGVSEGTGLNHSELTIHRMVWFTVADQPTSDFRIMTTDHVEAPEATEEADDAANDHAAATAHSTAAAAAAPGSGRGQQQEGDAEACGCGRRRPVDGAGAAETPSVPWHLCHETLFGF